MATRRAVAAVGLFVTVAACAVWGADASAAPRAEPSERFYATPRKLRAAALGDVIRAEPIDAPAGARAWRVLYRSETVAGRPIAVSGVVVAPVARSATPRPVVSWAHGTTGLADRCAPSRFPLVATRIPLVDEFVRAGYVVAATDYEGLGTEGPHPYLVGQSEGRGVLDAARAARRLPDAGAGAELVVAGHSQGGQAALFAGELAGGYAPELELRGVVAIAPVTDLSLLLGAAGTIPQAAGYAVMAAVGFRAAYADADLDALLTPEAAARIDLLESTCAGDVIAGYQDLPVPAYALDPRTTPPFTELIAENTPARVATTAPVLVAHGTVDSLVPISLSQLFFPRLCAAGNIAELRTYEGATHGSVVAAAGPDIGGWIADRLAGARAASTCAGG